MTFILTERRTGFATITLNRPEKLNAFRGTMREDLVAALRDLGGDASIRAIIISGAGRAFCSGGDVDSMSELWRQRDVEALRKLLDAGREVVLAIRSLRPIVVAAVNGVAAGAGCNLALACDYRIASRTATFGETFVRIGLHPDWGGTWFLPRLTGPGRALELMATGRMVDADEALAIGLVERVVAHDSLMSEAEALAGRIADGPPVALGDLKRAVYASAGNDLGAQLDLESEHQLRAFLSADAGEGMDAFFAKRPPRFRGV